MRRGCAGFPRDVRGREGEGEGRGSPHCQGVLGGRVKGWGGLMLGGALGSSVGEGGEPSGWVGLRAHFYEGV